jgi:hypothetical protein
MADLVIQQGVDSGYMWPVLNELGEPFDLTGYTVKAEVRAYSTNVLLYSFGTSSGNAIIADNNIILSWTSGQTTIWRWNQGKYDLEIVSPLGAVTKIDRGHVEVVKEVTL